MISSFTLVGFKSNLIEKKNVLIFYKPIILVYKSFSKHVLKKREGKRKKKTN